MYRNYTRDAPNFWIPGVTVIDVLYSQIHLLRTPVAVYAIEVESIGQFSRPLPFIFFSFDILEIGNAMIDAAID